MVQVNGRYLVTGGAGYVGSHCVALLVRAGAEVVVLDNLRQGHREAVLEGVRFVEADITDADRVLAEGRWDGVLHFAAHSLVGESMREPMLYFSENAGSGFRLIEACLRHGVKKFVLSSTANLFGQPDEMPITEAARINPGSPYGESKLMIERALHWAGEIHGLRSACLRYFNAAGADAGGRARRGSRSGNPHHPARPSMRRLGGARSWSCSGPITRPPDGTAVRDYVHVTDLGQAHLLALGQPRRGQRDLQSRQRRRALGAGRDRLGRARARAAGPARIRPAASR